MSNYRSLPPRSLRTLLIAWWCAISWSARAGDLDVSIEAGYRTGDLGVGYYALLVAGLNWERVLGPSSESRRLESVAWFDDLSRGFAEGPQPTVPRASDESSAPTPSADAPSPAPADAEPASDGKPLPTASLLLSSRFAMQLVEAVEREYRKHSRDAYFASLGSRSRSSALLPVLRLRAGRSADQTLRLSPTDDDPNRWLQSGGADFRYEAQATWTLDRLVFTNDEIAIERVRAQSDRERTARIETALELLFRWQRLGLEQHDPELEESKRLLLELERLQIAVQLDVLSGGWFGRHGSTTGSPDSQP